MLVMKIICEYFFINMSKFLLLETENERSFLYHIYPNFQTAISILVQIVLVTESKLLRKLADTIELISQQFQSVFNLTPVQLVYGIAPS